MKDPDLEPAMRALMLERQIVPDEKPKSVCKAFRVLHVLDHSRPLLSGYSVRSHSLIVAQKKIGFRPCAITGPLHQLDDRDGADTIIEEISYQRTPLLPGLLRRTLSRRIPVARELAVVKLLRKRILAQLDQEPIDLVHAHSPALCGLAALQAARARGIPFVYEIRAFWEDAAVDQNKTRPASPRYMISRRLEGYVARNADAVVGIAQHILDDLHERGLSREKLFHVPNGVDADRFVALPRDAQLASELGLGKGPVMGFIGSLYRYEGIAWFVRAAAELRRRGVAFQVLIVGQGEEMPEIQAAIRENGAQGYVHTVGQVPHDQIQRYYSLMDIMVYPRRRIRLTELTTPLKPLEAMAQGKAVLASDVGGIRELVAPEIPCLLFEPDDIEDFSRKSTQLLGDESFRHRLGESGRQMILREKDWKVLARRYEAVYEFAGRERSLS
ncbi:MAG TPA: glycosyltransferase [Candidatus Binatus sp.]|nr:glycosyltransferase [Candidatus Binatus sp.]